MAHFIWTLLTPDLKDCYHEKLGLGIMKVSIGVVLQVLCSYITFPLYGLVTQMGTHMKTIFEEQTAKAVMKWRKTARNKVKQREAGFDGMMSADTTPSHSRAGGGSSPVHLLQKCRGRPEDPESAPASPSPSPGRVQELGDMYPVAEQHRMHRPDPEKETGGGGSQRRGH